MARWLSQWILLYVAFCTIMAQSLHKEVRSPIMLYFFFNYSKSSLWWGGGGGGGGWCSNKICSPASNCIYHVCWSLYSAHPCLCSVCKAFNFLQMNQAMHSYFSSVIFCVEHWKIGVWPLALQKHQTMLSLRSPMPQHWHEIMNWGQSIQNNIITHIHFCQYISSSSGMLYFL